MGKGSEHSSVGIEYIQTRPDHLWSQPPKHEEAFSTPRSWHMLSDALHEYGDRLTDHWLEVLVMYRIAMQKRVGHLG